MFHLYLLPFVVFDFVSGAFDAGETLRGLRLKSGVEGNSVINSLARVMPQSAATVTYNLVKTVGFAALSLIPNPSLIGIAIGGLVASAAGHIQAGLKWRYLNNGGKIDRTRMYSWWEKLLGMGWE